MALQWELLITEFIVLAFIIASIYPMIYRWKQTKNRVFIAISVYMSAVATYAAIMILSYILEFDMNIDLIGYLPIGHILGYMMFTIQAVFLLYVIGWKKLYTFPFVFSFYLLSYSIMVNTSMHFIIYAVIISWIPAIFFMQQGRKNRNGIAFGMGLFLLIWGLGQSIPIPIVFQFFKIGALVLFYLGVKGFYEKYIFVDQKEEQKIKATWITKFVE